MKSLKVLLAVSFFVTSITFHEQVLKTSDNVFMSKWSVTFGMQTSHAVMLAIEDMFITNFE
jgi:hypothetical protein